MPGGTVFDGSFPGHIPAIRGPVPCRNSFRSRLGAIFRYVDPTPKPPLRPPPIEISPGSGLRCCTSRLRLVHLAISLLHSAPIRFTPRGTSGTPFPPDRDPRAKHDSRFQFFPTWVGDHSPGSAAIQTVGSDAGLLFRASRDGGLGGCGFGSSRSLGRTIAFVPAGGGATSQPCKLYPRQEIPARQSSCDPVSHLEAKTDIRSGPKRDSQSGHPDHTCIFPSRRRRLLSRAGWILRFPLPLVFTHRKRALRFTAPGAASRGDRVPGHTVAREGTFLRNEADSRWERCEPGVGQPPGDRKMTCGEMIDTAWRRGIERQGDRNYAWARLRMK